MVHLCEHGGEMDLTEERGREQTRYASAWRGYRWRLGFLAIAPAALLVFWPFIAEVTGKTIYGALLLGSFVGGFQMICTWRCPRCKEFYFMDWPLTAPTAVRCLRCGLPKWAAGPEAT
jgi:hypothetical protein